MLEILLGSKTPLTVLAYGSHRVQVLLINVKVREKLLHICRSQLHYMSTLTVAEGQDMLYKKEREHFKFSLNKEF